MLPIICKGRGLIPRIGIIAPVLTPFKVNLQTLTVIIKTPGSTLKPYFVDPVTSEEIGLDNSNFKKIYESYENRVNTVVEVSPGLIQNDKLESVDTVNNIIPNMDSSQQDIADDESENVKLQIPIIIKEQDPTGNISDDELELVDVVIPDTNTTDTVSIPVIAKIDNAHDNKNNYNNHNNKNNYNKNKDRR